MSEVVKELLQSLSIHQQVTLVNNPQADGVERSIREVIRHLRALLVDERILEKWSSNLVLPWVQFTINSTVSTETGVTPFSLTYGKNDMEYFNIPLTLESSNSFIQSLSTNLQLLRERSHKFQLSRKSARESVSPETSLNRYVKGDFVFMLLDEQREAKHKLKSRKKGPYSVEMHPDGSNVVHIRDLITDAVIEVNQKVLQRFTGTLTEAKHLASLDNDQYRVLKILGFKGNIEIHTSIQILVLFADQDQLWVTYFKDIAETEAFQDYFALTKFYAQILLPVQILNSKRKATKENTVDPDLLGLRFYINARRNLNWFENDFNVPDKYTVHYYFAATVTRINKKQNDYSIKLDLVKSHPPVDNWFMYLHMQKTDMFLGDICIDEALITKYNLKIPKTM